MAYKSAYTADSDADDEFERQAFDSPAVQQDLSLSESDDMTSPEHTPTTFTRSHSGDSHSPTTLITEWTSAQCAEYLKRLGLGQYADAVMEEAIDGAALVEMQQQDLKDVGISSVGHRLTLLKGVYEIKVRQNIPMDTDHYVPLSAEDASREMVATQEDITRVIDSIRLRDQRIIAAEAELRLMKEDVHRLLEENRKLREETLPLIRRAKDWSHPLPNPEQAITTPPPDLKAATSGLSRKFSTKRLFLGNAPKNPSPTVQEASTLDPSAAAMAASNHLTASMTSQSSPNTTQQLSPTSPAYSLAPSSATRHFPRANSDAVPPSASTRAGPVDDNYTHYNPTRDTQATLTAPTLTPAMSSSSTTEPMPTPRREKRSTTSTNNNSSSNNGGSSSSNNNNNNNNTNNNNNNNNSSSSSNNDDSNIEIFKSFRVSIEDPCHKVLPVALKRYNINDDWRQYALYIVHGDQERCLGLEEKPLLLFKQLDREGRKPMFMLRKHASPAGEGWTGPGGGGAAGLGAGAGAGLEGRGVPGGVL